MLIRSENRSVFILIIMSVLTYVVSVIKIIVLNYMFIASGKNLCLVCLKNHTTQLLEDVLNSPSSYKTQKIITN